MSTSLSAVPATVTDGAALAVEDLEVAYTVRGIDRAVLRGVTFHVAPGEAYGLVGESGCGKSTTAYAALRYLPRNGKITNGRVLVAGGDVTAMSTSELQRFRATEASMVYQDPGQAMNPSLRIGRQLIESFTLLGQSKEQARASALEALRKVHIADPTRVMDRYPFQLSGGMQQRVVIAMALACNPKLLVLDEPTTGLDATVEAEVLDLVRTLRAESDAAVLLIAHNLGIIRSLCDRVGVMYAGKIVEEGPSRQVFDDPAAPVHRRAAALAPPPRRPQDRAGLGHHPRDPAADRNRPRRRACSSIGARSPMIAAAPSSHRFVPVGTDGTRFTRCHHPDRIADIEPRTAWRRDRHPRRLDRQPRRARALPRLQDVPAEQRPTSRRSSTSN